jgi:hypothetical protein
MKSEEEAIRVNEERPKVRRATAVPPYNFLHILVERKPQRACVVLRAAARIKVNS